MDYDGRNITISYSLGSKYYRIMHCLESKDCMSILITSLSTVSSREFNISHNHFMTATIDRCWSSVEGQIITSYYKMKRIVSHSIGITIIGIKMTF